MMPGNMPCHISKYQFHYISNFKDIKESIFHDACVYVPLVAEINVISQYFSEINVISLEWFAFFKWELQGLFLALGSSTIYT